MWKSCDDENHLIMQHEQSRMNSLVASSTHERISTPKIITTPAPPYSDEYTNRDSCTTNVHGYIACTSENNMVEINLRFPKCKCNKLRLQSPFESGIIQNNNQVDSNYNGIDEADEEANNDNELKKKIINFNHDNLSSIITNLDIETCTNCNIALDIKALLTRIFSNSALHTYSASNVSGNLDGGSTIGAAGAGIGDGSILSKSPCLSDGNVSATIENDEFILFNLNKKRGSEDRRSTGTQSDNPSRTNKKNIIVITDEFKKRVTEHEIVVKKKKYNTQKKRHLSKSLEELSTPELEQRKFLSHATHNNHVIINTTENDINSTNNKTSNNNKMIKSRSKSVDDISSSSNEVLEGVDSVELIFISDEFLHKATTQQPEVIIVDEPSKKPSLSPLSIAGSDCDRLSNGSQSNKKKKDRSPKNKSPADRSPKDSNKKLYVISDEFKNKSLNNTVIVVKQKAEKTKSKGPGSTGPSPLNLKTTATNSNTFLTYEEPWSPVDDLESKKFEDAIEIQ